MLRPWITAGRSGSSITFTSPFTRSRLGPRFFSSAASSSCSAWRVEGSSRVRQNEAMESSWLWL